MVKFFITGITGFIGSELVKMLAENEENEIFGLVRHTSSKKLERIEEDLDRITILIGNLIDNLAIAKIVKSVSPEYIIHIGAIIHVSPI